MTRAKVILSIIFFIILLIIFIKVISSVLDKNLIYQTLTKRYGDGKWQITAKEPYAYFTGAGLSNWWQPDGYRYTVISEYTNQNPFHIYVNDVHMVTEDDFLPTYHSIQYGLSYTFSTTQNQRDEFNTFLEKISSVMQKHYLDKKFSKSQIEVFYSPKFVQKSPNKFIKPDMIPNEGRIYQLEEITSWLKNYTLSPSK